jgi:hypothetical protein
MTSGQTQQYLIALSRVARTARRLLVAIMRRPDLCDCSHDQRMYAHARWLATTARAIRPDVVYTRAPRY